MAFWRSLLFLSAIWSTAYALQDDKVFPCQIVYRQFPLAMCVRMGFKEIPRQLPDDIKEINLSWNYIEEVGPGAFGNLTKLQKIVLSNNKIRFISYKAFNGLRNLRELDLSHNNLSSIPRSIFYDFTALMKLTMSYNPLKTIKAESFPNLQKIETLELKGCQITSIDPQAFRGLGQVWDLNLADNELRTLHPRTFQFFSSSLIELHLYDNPWRCDCQTRELFEWVTAKKKISWFYGIGSPTCRSPSSARGHDWRDLRATDFHCAPEWVETYGTTIAEVGGTIYLYCEATGEPLPELEWKRVNRTIRNSVRFNLSKQVKNNVISSNLTIRNVSDYDNAFYSCIARNIGGTIFHIFQVETTKRTLPKWKWASAIVPLLAILLVLLVIFFSVTLCCIWVRKKRCRKQNAHKASLRVIRRGVNSDKSSQMPLYPTGNAISQCYSQHSGQYLHPVPETADISDPEMLEKYLNDQQYYRSNRSVRSGQADRLSDYTAIQRNDSGLCTNSDSTDNAPANEYEVPRLQASTGRRTPTSSRTPLAIRTPVPPLKDQSHIETDLLVDDSTSYQYRTLPPKRNHPEVSFLASPQQQHNYPMTLGRSFRQPNNEIHCGRLGDMVSSNRLPNSYKHQLGIFDVDSMTEKDLVKTLSNKERDQLRKLMTQEEENVVESSNFGTSV